VHRAPARRDLHAKDVSSLTNATKAIHLLNIYAVSLDIFPTSRYTLPKALFGLSE
jgi:hypothetical protein